MISFAGFALHPPTKQQMDWARATIDPARLWPEFVQRPTPGPALAHLPFWPLLDQPPELGQFVWPRGAARWACGHWLVDSVTLAGLRGACYPAGVQTARPFVIDDGTRALTTALYLLPSRPLTQFTSGDTELHLITLVDARYYGWFKSAAVTISAGTTTWTQLFTALASALGITLAVDPIPAAYLKPPAQLAAQYESLPVLLDAAAAAVGMRVVANYDGTFKCQNPANGQAQANANLAAAFVKKAGGQTPAADVTATLPKKVTVAFPRSDTPGADYAKEVLVGGGAQAANRPLHSSAVMTGGNGAEIDALAAQLAADWFAFNAGRWDVAYWGCAAWVPDSQTDRVEWTHWKDVLPEDGIAEGDFSTRALTGELDDWPSMPLPHQSSGGSGTFIADISGGSWSWTNLTLNLSTVTFNVTGLLNVTGSGYWVVNIPFEICGYQFWCCANYTLASGSVNDLNLPGVAAKTVYNLSRTGGTVLTGIVPAKPDGVTAGPQLIALTNTGADAITINHDDAASAAANRILLPPTYGSAVALAQNDSIVLWYDTCTSTKWRVFACTVDPDSGSSSTTFSGARVYSSTSTSNIASSGSYTNLTGGNANPAGVCPNPYDTDSYWGNLGLNPSGVTIPFNGWYNFSMWVDWDGLPAQPAPLALKINNATKGEIITQVREVATSTSTPGYQQNCAGDSSCGAGDVINYQVSQTNGLGSALILTAAVLMLHKLPGK